MKMKEVALETRYTSTRPDGGRAEVIEKALTIAFLAEDSLNMQTGLKVWIPPPIEAAPRILLPRGLIEPIIAKTIEDQGLGELHAVIIHTPKGHVRKILSVPQLSPQSFFEDLSDAINEYLDDDEEKVLMETLLNTYDNAHFIIGAVLDKLHQALRSEQGKPLSVALEEAFRSVFA